MKPDTESHDKIAPPHPEPRGLSRGFVLVALIVVALLLVWQFSTRIIAHNALAKDAETAAIMSVQVIQPSHGPATQDLVLPGNVEAWVDAPIYARVSGYMKDWKVDIGGKVRAGQLLAEIETPETDQQLRAAEANAATAKANYDLAQTTSDRWKQLYDIQSVSKQDLDTRIGNTSAAKASYASAEASVQQLRATNAFKRVIAPFDGVVTERNTDVGALINAGSSSGVQLFRVADTHKLRVYVQVPQLYAAAIRPGVTAKLLFAEYPGQQFDAKLASTAEAINATSRTLLVQLQVGNADGRLFPGGYTEVHFVLPSSVAALRVPANTLLFRDTMEVGTVTPGNQVALKKVTIGRDFGKEVEIMDGIGPDDSLIINPPDSIIDGEPVRIVEAKKDDKKNGDQPAGASTRSN
jgi:RND family efflux transporter MFP subunit